MGSNHIGQTMILFITVPMMFVGVRSDLAQDMNECADTLSDLSACLPFVTSQAKAPNPTCCNTLRREIDQGQTRRCLCVLVKDRDDPGLGFKVDANLALSLPSICHAPANVSKCPELLHLPPDSRDAQVFKQFAASSQSNGTRGGSTSSSGRARGMGHFGLGMVGAVLVWDLV